MIDLSPKRKRRKPSTPDELINVLIERGYLVVGLPPKDEPIRRAVAQLQAKGVTSYLALRAHLFLFGFQPDLIDEVLDSLGVAKP